MTTARLQALVAGIVALTVADAYARPYPVNVCVAAKQRAAAKYCASVLRGWGGWESTQDNSQRDDSIATAAQKVEAKWVNAETKATKRGSDCVDTTLTSPAVQTLIDSAVGAIVDQINTGLDVDNRSNARCGGKLLRATGKKCLRLLRAEARHIKDLAKDTDGAKLTAARSSALGKFTAVFQRVVTGGCPTTATATQVENAVDALVADVVRETTVSPNVDDTQFIAISPTGPIKYLGDTLEPKCIKDTPYAFFAKRGSENKLLVYYEGGGACWEQLTCMVPVCDATVKTTSGAGSDNPNFATTGFADQSNPANPFRNWNVVFVSYCSCDVHFGNAAQDYNNINPANPVHIEHRGFQNARVVEKWAREHFLDPEQVFVTGSSAGAYGAWFHAPLLHETWPAAHFQVLADAGNGVITQDFLETYFPNWNFIGNIPPEFPEVKQIIESGGGVPEYTDFVAHRFPATRWAHYSTAYDGGTGGQTGFYNIMLNNNDVLAALSWWNGSCQFNEKMRQQAIASAAAIPSNYRYYIGTGSRHTMWGSNKVYSDTTGGVPTLVDWVNAMLDGTAAWTNVECADCGLLLSGDPRPPSIPTAPFFQVGPDVKIICSPSGAFLDATD
jgi:hypothetical protein